MKRALSISLIVGMTAVLAIAAGNVVPPSDGGADLGTASLKWGSVYANRIGSDELGLSTNVSLFTGILTSRASLVTSTLTTNCGIGSVYFSNGGKIFLRVGNSNPDATNDWYIVDTDNSDESSP